MILYLLGWCAIIAGTCIYIAGLRRSSCRPTRWDWIKLGATLALLLIAFVCFVTSLPLT